MYHLRPMRNYPLLRAAILLSLILLAPMVSGGDRLSAAPPPEDPSPAVLEGIQREAASAAKKEADGGPVESVRGWLGETVYANDGKPLGKLRDLALDLESGIVALALIERFDAGGANGAEKIEEDMGGQIVPLPPALLMRRAGDNRLRVTVSEERLREVPELPSAAKLPGVERRAITAIYAHFQTPSPWDELRQQLGWGPDTLYGRRFRPGETQELSGRVVKVTTLRPMQGMAPGVQVELMRNGRPVVVQLGPLAYFSQRDIAFQAGQPLTIVAAPVSMDPAPLYIASRVTWNDGSVVLRDEQGNAPWRSWTEADERYGLTSLRGLLPVALVNPQGESLGRVVDFGATSNRVAEAGDRRLRYAVVEYGPPDARLRTAMPLGAIVAGPDQPKWLCELPRQTFAEMPTFAESSWPTAVDRGWIEYIAVRYGSATQAGVRSQTATDAQRQQNPN